MKIKYHEMFHSGRRIVVSNAAGGIITSSNDITKFLQLHLNLGKVDGKQVIPEVIVTLTKIQDVIQYVTAFECFIVGGNKMDT